MKFKPYNKIHALHKEECEGILEGTCYIQEKVDGANASIWLGDDGEIHYGSRSRDLFLANDNFNGFGDWVRSHPQLKFFFEQYPAIRINGEWLVRHTIGYRETSYKKFYAFDMEQSDGGLTMVIDFDDMYFLATTYEIPAVQLHGKFENPSMELIKSFAGQSVLGEKGEGVVVKNLSYRNKFGDVNFGKYVTQEFKEDNGVTFGGNNKFSETYEEMYFVNKLVTLPRVEKTTHKLESMEGKLSEKHIPRVMGMVFYDVMSEEGNDMANHLAKNGADFNFKKFRELCNKKSKSIFMELLTGDVSVANL